MRLPGISYERAVSDSSASAAAPEALSKTSQSIAQGLEAFGRELVRTQMMQARARLSSSLDEIDRDLSGKPYVSAKEIRDALGDDIERLPPGVREMLEVTTPSGEKVDNDQIPTWAVRGALFERRASAALDSAAGGVTAMGWREEFKASSQSALQERRHRLNQTAAKEMLEYQQKTQGQSLRLQMNTATTPQEWWGEGGIHAQIDESQALDPAQKDALHAEARKTEQIRPTLDALREWDEEGMRRERDRLNDEKQLPDVDPETRRAMVRQLEAQIGALDKAKKPENQPDPKKIAYEQAMGQMQQLVLDRERGGQPLGPADEMTLLGLMPKAMDLHPKDWDSMRDFVKELTTGSEMKTDDLTYLALYRAYASDPEGFKSGKGFTYTDPRTGKERTGAKLQDFFSRLAGPDRQEFVRLAFGSDKGVNVNVNVNNGPLSDMDLVRSGLREYGFDLDAKNERKQGAAAAALRLVNTGLANAASAKGAPLTEDEKSATIRRVLKSNTKRVSSWFGPDVYVFKDSEAPPEIVQGVRDMARARGVTIGDADVEDYAKFYIEQEEAIDKAWGEVSRGAPLDMQKGADLLWELQRNRVEGQLDKAIRGQGKDPDDRLRALTAARLIANRSR